ncbi:hypothetical protein [Streptomyces hirsutus]|uniref:hypothetical protein n=1 Tax=Streptomyces hirsutus TaxID=35620 RepID=UPI00331886AF
MPEKNDGLRHRVGCPAKRVETFEVERHNRDHSVDQVPVKRCVDCGVQEVSR